VAPQALVRLRASTKPFAVPVRRLLTSPKVRILLYHSVGDYPDDPYSVTPERFASHVAALRAHRVPILSLRSVLTTLPIRARGVVVTFDDALHDFLINALPALVEYRVPATMYVPTGKVGLVSDWSWRDTSRPVMSWDDLLQCQAAGIELESHTVTHPDLTRISEAELAIEMESARDELRRRTGGAPLSIAYPYGYVNGLVKAMASRYYRAGLAVGGLWGLSAATDLYEIPRYLIKGDTTDREIMAIARGHWDVRHGFAGAARIAKREREDGR
jgi:peptidoglycan/xylan/chitin deacetylase (PgdA/CDA1 family)